MSEASRASGIEIVRDPDRAALERRGVFLWEVWTKEPARFPWTYDDEEVCDFLEGDVVVTPDGGEPVRMGAGDLVTFPAGMSCTWEVRAAVRKHYTFASREGRA
jgi:uncharacterized cupin superfamily protein